MMVASLEDIKQFTDLVKTGKVLNFVELAAFAKKNDDYKLLSAALITDSTGEAGKARTLLHNIFVEFTADIMNAQITSIGRKQCGQRIFKCFKSRWRELNTEHKDFFGPPDASNDDSFSFGPFG